MITYNRQSRYSRKDNRKENLGLWHRVTLASVKASGPDLSARQLAVLMSVYLEDGEHTVRSLAEALEVTKAVITRALDTLSGHGFVSRAPDIRDKRSIIVTRTTGGILYLQRFADIIQTQSQQPQPQSADTVRAAA